jgi:hypothetical protein
LICTRRDRSRTNDPLQLIGTQILSAKVEKAPLLPRAVIGMNILCLGVGLEKEFNDQMQLLSAPRVFAARVECASHKWLWISVCG